MNDSASSDHETGSYSTIDLIDRLCDRFEQELRQDSRPRIEDYLTRVDAPVRDRLLRDLIAIEFEFAQSKGAVKFDQYFQRFPESLELLQALQKELESSGKKSPKTPELELELTQDCTVVAVSPSKIGHFQLLEIAGSGGFGVVWRAMDLRLQREVAVKIPRTDRAGRVDLSAITREAQVAAKLRHPNIVTVHEVGEDNGTSFIVTDYIHGINLKEWKKKNSIGPLDAARLVAKIAIAVQHAHDMGVIHRDLKLANVLMDAKGEPHVADFGLAKREARDDSLAVDGQVLGTPAYMAPEQARADHASIDRRTDVYSLGVILYELVTGTTPFRGEVILLLQQILDSAPVALRSIKPDVPKDLEAICLKCLAKDNAKRYDSAQALADDLFLFLNGETLRGVPAALPSRVWKWFRRNRRFVVITSAVALLVALVSSGLMALRNGGTKPNIAVSPVEFTTQPAGCEITVVALDPETGEPDPAKLQTARGRTPLKMSLAPGDYLVVAVLDPHRFHEVYRRVPEPHESATFKYDHLWWQKRPSGEIELRPIQIPRPDISLEMGFCEGTDQLVEPTARDKSPPKSWRVPAFYVDLREVSATTLNEWKSRGFGNRATVDNSGDGSVALLHYYHSVDLMEAIGRRLPSAAELYYLSTNICPPSATTSDIPCVLNKKTVIEGLHSGIWEWTSTKPGGPFSGSSAVPKELGIEALSRMIGGGNVGSELGSTQTGFKVSKAHFHETGVRGVRSIAPRRNPQDFVSIVKGKSE